MVTMPYNGKRKKLLRRMGKFALVGGSGSLLYWLFLYIFTDLVGLWYMFSAIICTGIIFFYSFTLHSVWTFRRGK